MAANLSKWLRVLQMGVLCMAGAACAAEQLNDPTRPAFELVPGLKGSAPADAQAAPQQGLQSVMLLPGREAAIINGVKVARGEKYGDATLAVVKENCVVLMGPQGRRVMYMFPAVQMSKSQLACASSGEMRPKGTAAAKRRAPKKKVKAEAKTEAKTGKPASVCLPAEEHRDKDGK